MCLIQQPGPVDPVLACMYLVCSLHSHLYILDQPRNRTGADHKIQFGLQKKNPWCQPASPKDLIHVQIQGMGRNHHCRLIITPRRDVFQLLSADSCYRAPYTERTGRSDSFFREAITVRNSQQSHTVTDNACVTMQ